MLAIIMNSFHNSGWLWSWKDLRDGPFKIISKSKKATCVSVFESCLLGCSALPSYCTRLVSAKMHFVGESNACFSVSERSSDRGLEQDCTVVQMHTNRGWVSYVRFVPQCAVSWKRHSWQPQVFTFGWLFLDVLESLQICWHNSKMLTVLLL